jgi:hypothetical protein
MDSWVLRIVGGLVVFAAIFGVRYCNGTERRNDASKEVLVAAQEMIKDVPGYQDDPAYFDWLVSRGHSEVFSESYTIDAGRRRYSSGGDQLDFGKYENDLFTWMIDRAKTDQRTKIAEHLQAFKDGPAPGEEPDEPKEPDNPFLKK